MLWNPIPNGHRILRILRADKPEKPGKTLGEVLDHTFFDP